MKTEIKLSKTNQIFIVGSSRSGTTMMGRILDNHPSILTFNELHFFGTLWANSSSQELSQEEQITLLSRLLCIQENGLFSQKKISEFNYKSKKLIKDKSLDSLEIYELFLKEVTIENSAKISCEQTPKNIYYLNEILQYFPNAKVINMVRDQRDVLLSQKNKWKRRFLGASAIPFYEAIRSYINYHPILTSKVWNSSLQHTCRYKNHQRVKIVKFEALLADSVETLKDICNFLEIDFSKKMLEVPVIGSSTEKDKKGDMRIDKSKIFKWKNGGLSDAEIYLSQKMSFRMLEAFNYPLQKFVFPPLISVYFLLLLPLKLFLAFLFNFHRMASIIEVIKKRFFIK